MRTARSSGRDRAELAAYRAAAAIVTGLGPTAADTLGAGLGQLLWWLARPRRRIVLANLAGALPNRHAASHRRLGAAASRHLGRCAVDLVRSARMSAGELEAAVEWQHPERFAEAVASGRGVIVATAHLGAWELAALAIGQRLGSRFTIIARSLDNPLLERKLALLRSRFGSQVVDARGAARNAIRQLRAGGAVGLLVDQRVLRRHAVEVPFFGRKVRTSPLAARLADRTEALMLPMVCLRRGPRQFVMSWLEPLDVCRLSAAERAAVPLTARLSAIVEAQIRRHPSQWLWHHDRWR